MKKTKINKKKILKLGWPFAILMILGLVIMQERGGIELQTPTNEEREAYDARLYEVTDDEFSVPVSEEVECLIIADSRDAQSNAMLGQMRIVLYDMRVGFDETDLAVSGFPDLSKYKKIVVTTGNLSVMEDDIITLCDWVKNGGQFMNTGTFQNDVYFQVLGAKAGILNTGKLQYSMVSGFRILNEFMINGEDREFWYDDSTETALNVSLMPESRIYIEDVVSGVPLLWEHKYGQGKFVMMNQVILDKVSRGILCAAYSLLGEACVYPVINGSVFYLDDFPSPVPSGDGKYIEEEFGVNISSFYSNIWWKDMIELEEKYGIVHTGLIIEDYSDLVKAPFPTNGSVERFEFFGNMLLNNGGELGFHGYNHMPLCLESYDYKGLYDEYNKWPDMETMEAAIAELQSFSQNLFPDARFGVYVPPSNILSEEGRQALKNSWPNIKVIASNYYEDAVGYAQEFEVAEDGIVEAPRITSGTMIDEYQMLAAFSELNFHYVQSHFLHPDDVLDEDRGAAWGWTKMYEEFTAYIDYIYSSVPNIRNLSGSGFGEAIREFDMLSVSRNITDKELVLELGGFYQEAYLLVRINEGNPGTVTGGSLESVTGKLYLLHATDDEVRIELTE